MHGLQLSCHLLDILLQLLFQHPSLLSLSSQHFCSASAAVTRASNVTLMVYSSITCSPAISLGLHSCDSEVSLSLIMSNQWLSSQLLHKSLCMFQFSFEVSHMCLEVLLGWCPHIIVPQHKIDHLGLASTLPALSDLLLDLLTINIAQNKEHNEPMTQMH